MASGLGASVPAWQHDVQFQLFYDYRNHVARFADIVAYHSEHQPPCLVLWGRHDTFYDIAEV